MMAILFALVILSFAISIYLFALLNRIRQDSKKSWDIASGIKDDWDRFSARETEERKQLDARFERFESATKDRVDQFEKVATGTRERLMKLEEYLRDFFEVELKTVFESFDKTVSAILEQMKSELLRGIERIEDIQAFVDSKSYAQDRILDGEGSVYRLLADPNAAKAAAQPAEEASEPLVRRADEERDAENPPAPPYRLEADETE